MRPDRELDEPAQASRDDYNQLRGYVPRRHDYRTPPERASRVSVMDWLLGIGHAALLRLRRTRTVR